ncbi:hypothetical protein CFP56_043558 [Quercus suber]|uniref:CBF1-interacting co-repressor CIR N-terminal domain-containing protein n=1 Tax=Quercus suber TaxID=58331 RepID=A0AAW0IRH5_QUESU
MGGHGGLNILPQKRWNVYNFDNREKVRRDEEAAAKEEQLKREQARKRDTEFRIERLRTARGLAPTVPEPEPEPAPEPDPEPAESEPKTGHINLFEGIRIFDPIKVSENKRGSEKDEFKKNKKMKKEEAPRVVGPEDEKYRLGMPNSNVRIESTMLNNGAHVVPPAHWENWKDDQSILNMDAIDNKFQEQRQTTNQCQEQ